MPRVTLRRTSPRRSARVQFQVSPLEDVSQFTAIMRFPIYLLSAACLLGALPATRAQTEVKDDDFLLFDMMEADGKAPARPVPQPLPDAPKAPPSQRPLPAKTEATLRTVLLDVPDKSFATARLATLSARASQEGAAAQPVIAFTDATVSLAAALESAAKAVVAANPKFPDGVTLTVSAGGGYGGHEKDAAAAATAILLEAVGTGRELDPEAALLGGVNEKGEFTAVARLATRLRTLETALPSVVGVPMVSEVEVRDLALMSELDVLTRIQVISLVTMDDARAVASKQRPEKVAKAMQLFATVQEAAARTPTASLLKSDKFLQRLREITTLMPNHLSSRLLLQAAANKVPGRITLGTSRQAILKAIKPFADSMNERGTIEVIRKTATEGGNVLLRMQPKVHPAVERYLMAMKTYLRSVNNYLEIRPEGRYAQMRIRAQQEMAKNYSAVETEKANLDKQSPTE